MAEFPIQAVTSALNDERVYGVPVKSYMVDGVPDKAFADAVAFASLRQSHAVESVANALTIVVKEREKRVSALSDALATLAEALGPMDPEEMDTDKESSINVAKLRAANEAFEKYGIEKMQLTDDGQVTYHVAYYKQNDVQLALDNENNELQQNMTTLQSLMNKRDSSFQVASRVVAKVNATISTTIQSLGY